MVQDGCKFPDFNLQVQNTETSLMAHLIIISNRSLFSILGEKVMVTRSTKLRQSIEANSNSDDQSIMDLEEVEDEVIKDDDKFKIIEPITTSSGS